MHIAYANACNERARVSSSGIRAPTLDCAHSSEACSTLYHGAIQLHSEVADIFIACVIMHVNAHLQGADRHPKANQLSVATAIVRSDDLSELWRGKFPAAACAALLTVSHMTDEAADPFLHGRR
jgi:hypothetical protein